MHARINEGLIIDSFSGLGGASVALEKALGRSPDIAINHSPVALAIHAANHPDTTHYESNVWAFRIKDAIIKKNKSIDYLWMSPSCVSFSKARGAVPVSPQERDLAWVLHAWLKELDEDQRPWVIFLENVVEFEDWAPLIYDADGTPHPDPERKGETFKSWVRETKRFGYKNISWRKVRACDYGSPTIRTRLFLVARRDRQKVRWPKPTHGDPRSRAVMMGKLKPWPVAADILDFSRPCPSIFTTREEAKAYYKLTGKRIIRPLAIKTQARIAKGIKRHIIDAQRAFVVTCNHSDPGFRGQGLDVPFRTLTAARDAVGLVSPFMVPRYGERAGQAARSHDATKAMPIVAPTSNTTLIAPHLTKFREGSVGSSVRKPVPTITANSFKKRPGCAGPIGVVEASFTSYGQQGGNSRPLTKPIHTLTASRKDTNQLMTASLVETDARNPAAFPPPETPDSINVAYLAQHNTGVIGHSAEEPVSTIVQKGCTQGVVTAHMLSLKGSTRRASDVKEPVTTICASGQHAAVVSLPMLSVYYGTDIDGAPIDKPTETLTPKSRFSLVDNTATGQPLTPEQYARAKVMADFLRTHDCWDEREIVTIDVDGQSYVLMDCGMRMLGVDESAKAMGFPDDYILDPELNGKPITETEQRHKIGNAVCWHPAAAIIEANRDINRDYKKTPRKIRETPLFEAA